MSTMVSGIQGQLLEVTVVGCSRLKDTEWISRQDPYVCLDYATTKFRTRTCTDGGKNPVFQEKTIIPLIEGLREISVTVWNSNTITFDDLIGSGKIQLQKVLSHGYDDSSWSLQSKSNRYAGDVKLIMHFGHAQRTQQSLSGYAPTASASYFNPYAAPMSVGSTPYPPPPMGAYPASTPYPAIASYPPPPTNQQQPYGYPPSSYPPQPYGYPPSSGGGYPPSSGYPPTQQAQPYGYPPSSGLFPGLYPPPPPYY